MPMPPDGNPRDIASFIRANLEPILQDWEDFARSMPPGVLMEPAALRDHARDILLALVQDLDAQQSAQASTAKARGLLPDNAPALTAAAEAHADGRHQERFSLNQLIAEFRAIRASVLRHWNDASPCDGAGVDRFNEAIDQAIAASVARYALKTEQSRNIILGMLAHDLRTPLQVLLLSAQTLLDHGQLAAAQAAAAQRVVRNARQMSDLVSDLLRYAKSELIDPVPATRRPVNLEVLVQNCIGQCGIAYPQHTVRLSVTGPVTGEWDPDRITQVITNLLVNALQHGERGAGVDVSLHGDDQHVSLSVRNQGEAIPAHLLPDLFVPLHERTAQEGASASAGSSGLHLGLYISQTLARSHGGSLDVESSSQQGTTFTLRLPRFPAQTVPAS